MTKSHVCRLQFFSTASEVFDDFLALARDLFYSIERKEAVMRTPLVFFPCLFCLAIPLPAQNKDIPEGYNSIQPYLTSRSPPKPSTLD